MRTLWRSMLAGGSAVHGERVAAVLARIANCTALAGKALVETFKFLPVENPVARAPDQKT
jgi:hypothetical protein